MTILKEGIEKIYTDLQELNAGTTSFAESTRAELAAGAIANEEAHQKASHIHSEMNDLCAKTELTFAENEKKITDRRDGIRVWSGNFATQIQQMCAPANALLEQWLSGGATVAPCAQCRPPITVTKRYKAIDDEDNDTMIVPIEDLVKTSRNTKR